MIDTFVSGGYFMWAPTLAGLLVVVLAARSAWRLRGPAPDPEEATAGADAALFWGVFAGVLGLLGTLVGIAQMARVIHMAQGEVSAGLVWSGLGNTLITSLYGISILLVALLLWFGLRSAARFRAAPGTIG